MKKTIDYLLIPFFVFLFASLISSCANTQKLAYFSNIPRDTVTNIQQQTFQTVISKNDILQISFSSLDETTSRLLNGGSLSTTGTSNPQGVNPNSVSTTPGSINGLLVDEGGVIKLPLLGEVKAAGLTKSQLADFISSELVRRQISKDAIVTVRIVNYKITVLGEVNHPGVIPVPNERMTLPEALGQAGDLTVYGNRNNVLLIREDGSKRIYKRFSLNYDQMFNKDIYYLQNQDIIYVQPNSARAATADRSTQLAPILISVVSLLLVIYEVFKK